MDDQLPQLDAEEIFERELVEALRDSEIARRYGPSCIGMPMYGTTRSVGAQWMLRATGPGGGWFTAVRQPGAPDWSRNPHPCACAEAAGVETRTCRQDVLPDWEARLRYPGQPSTIVVTGEDMETVLEIFPAEIAERYRQAIVPD